MTAPEPIFGCRGIGISFGNRTILRDVSLAVSPGEVLGLVGPNGAGKTSLFEILCGRYTASGGQVMLKGQDITALSVHDRARLGLARTYQSPVVPAALQPADHERGVTAAVAVAEPERVLTLQPFGERESLGKQIVPPW